MAEVQTLPDYPRGLDFEQVWAGLMENREQIKDTERIVKEVGEGLNLHGDKRSFLGAVGQPSRPF